MSLTTEISSAPVHAATQRRSPLRVVMMDLLSIVPYYDGHLYSALAGIHEVELTLAAITYQHDRTYFARERIRLRPGLDILGRLRLPKMLARAAKGLEAAVNLALLAVRLVLSRPDVLHVQFMPLWEIGVPFEWWVVRLAQRMGVRVVHTVHNLLPAPSEGRTEDFHFPRYRRVYKSADALICHSEEAKIRLIHDFDIHPSRITVIPHGPLFSGLGSTPQPDARRKLRLDPDSVVVLWQGILRPYKGVDFLLEAWHEVSERSGNAILAIIGGGNAEINSEIRARVDALALQSSVRLDLRFVAIEELACWYSAADVLVYPYRESTTSGALMTGYNHAKPVIATDLPAFRQVIRHGENGLLVTYGDTASLADSLHRLISQPALRESFRERMRRSLSSGPQWPSVARATAECYRAVASGGGV